MKPPRTTGIPFRPVDHLKIEDWQQAGNCEQSGPDIPLSFDEAKRLRNHVLAQLPGRFFELQILPHGDGLVLLGSVQTYYLKQLVQEIVRKSTKTPIAENAIEVG